MSKSGVRRILTPSLKANKRHTDTTHVPASVITDQRIGCLLRTSPLLLFCGVEHFVSSNWSRESSIVGLSSSTVLRVNQSF
eukprot:scaffold7641_cov115-Cylindrotheca_fusiformis.AAC.15